MEPEDEEQVKDFTGAIQTGKITCFQLRIKYTSRKISFTHSTNH